MRRKRAGLGVFAFVAGIAAAFACGGTVRTGAPEHGSGGAGQDDGGEPSGSGGKASGGSPGGKCTPPKVICGSDCVSLNSDASNCGTCGTVCPDGYWCAAGDCLQNRCPGTLSYCSNWSDCLDLDSNAFACGSCTNACSNGAQCVNGECVEGTCAYGTYCPYEFGGGACANLDSDTANCGSCNSPCGDPYETCEDGKCVPPDCGGEGYDFCPAYGCADVLTDPVHCGSCDSSCGLAAPFDYAAYQCTGGSCGCGPLAHECGEGCATEFWYCPEAGDTLPAFETCEAGARNAYQRCACDKCLEQVLTCSGDVECVNAMDCTMNSVCVGCDPPFSECYNDIGPNPLALELITCLNELCAAP